MGSSVVLPFHMLDFPTCEAVQQRVDALVQIVEVAISEPLIYAVTIDSTSDSRIT